MKKEMKSKRFTTVLVPFPINLTFLAVLDEKTRRKTMEDGEDGVFSSQGGEFCIAIDLVDAKPTVYVAGVVVHEVQHLLQGIEKFTEARLGDEAAAYFSQYIFTWIMNRIVRILGEKA